MPLGPLSDYVWVWMVRKLYKDIKNKGMYWKSTHGENQFKKQLHNARDLGKAYPEHERAVSMSLEQKKCRFINDCQHNNRMSQWILMLSRGCAVTSRRQMLPFLSMFEHSTSDLTKFQLEYFYGLKFSLWLVLITKDVTCLSAFNKTMSLRTSWKNL